MQTTPAWAVEFHSFTWLHAVSLFWTVVPIAISCWLGRRWLRRGRVDLEERLALAWGGFVVGVNAWSLIYWNLPDQFDLKESLPLQLCDLACLLSPLVYLTRWRWARTMLFFWGIGLSTEAFFTPTLRDGPADSKYYLFWLVHTSIVGTAIYDTVVRRYRPAVRDLLLAIGVTIGYAAAMFGVNEILDANYGFIGDQLRDRPTIIDRLGPWPLRVFYLAGIVIGLFVVMWGIASVVGGKNCRHGPQTGAPVTAI